jgi:hypothetical protein
LIRINAPSALESDSYQSSKSGGMQNSPQDIDVRSRHMKPFKLHPSAIDPIRTGLALGALIGLWNLSWSMLVAFGWAQPFIDFAFWMHFLKPPCIVQPFNLATAVILLIVTLSLGFVIGSIFAVLWNWIHKR